MMNTVIAFIFLLAFLPTCTPLNISEAPGHRQDDREGEVDADIPDDTVLEGLSWWELLKNCKPETDAPGSITDIATDIFGVSEHYAPGVVRGCVERKLSDAHTKICTARIQLERKRDRADDPATKARVENSIIKLDTMQFKFNQKLYNMALSLDDELEQQRSKGRAKTLLGRAFNFLKEDEIESLRDVLDIESYNTCGSYSEEEDY